MMKPFCANSNNRAFEASEIAFHTESFSWNAVKFFQSISNGK